MAKQKKEQLPAMALTALERCALVLAIDHVLTRVRVNKVSYPTRGCKRSLKRISRRLWASITVPRGEVSA